jgi:hypothetical protein
MPRTQEDLESYLERLGRRFERLEDGTLLVVVGPHQPPMALRLAPPVLVAQVDIGSVSGKDSVKQAKLFRRLLELNTGHLLHAAYGLKDDHIVLSSALELDNLDLNEIEAVLSDIDVALAEHVPELRHMVDEA